MNNGMGGSRTFNKAGDLIAEEKPQAIASDYRGTELPHQDTPEARAAGLTVAQYVDGQVVPGTVLTREDYAPTAADPDAE